MDLGDVADLMAHWAKNPPAHLAIGRAIDVLCVGLGVRIGAPSGPAPDEVAIPDTDEGLRALVAQVNGEG